MCAMRAQAPCPVLCAWWYLTVRVGHGVTKVGLRLDRGRAPDERWLPCDGSTGALEVLYCDRKVDHCMRV
eukprot:scaffold141690_cov127-Phaeocystis_antarctica.AAC.1